MKLTRIRRNSETVIIKPIDVMGLRRVHSDFRLYDFRFRTRRDCEYILRLSDLDLLDMGLTPNTKDA